MERGRFGAHALAYGCVVAAEEVIEDGAGSAAAALYIYQANNFCGLNSLVSSLLGNEHPLAKNGAVVHGSVQLFPLELDVGRRVHFLAPEALERREAGVFEAHQVGPLINLQNGGDRLSYHNGAAAQCQPHENVLLGRTCAGILALGLRSLAGLLLALLSTAHHLDGDGLGVDGIPLNLGRCRLDGEVTGLPGLQDIGVRSL